VADQQTFKGFFSYAHLDAEVDPDLIEALTARLEKRVTVKLLNARLEIWRDTKGLRTGKRWEPAIETAVRQADLLIVLLTPKWIASDYCRKEYLIFEEVEAGRGDGEYIAPILARSIEEHEHHLRPEQRPIYDSIRERQYFEALAVDFLALDDRGRDTAIDNIADDIAGIIERRRLGGSKPPVANNFSRRQYHANAEVTGRAQNFARVRFVSDEEIVVDRPRAGRERGVYAQADFIKRLYVEGETGRAEFGFHRTFVSVENQGVGRLSKIDKLRTGETRLDVYYTDLLDKPDAITVCADGTTGQSGLAELALPPSEGENRLSRLAVATDDVNISDLSGELRVMLDFEGLYLGNAQKRNLSQTNGLRLRH
jgi:hypothetical protein